MNTPLACVLALTLALPPAGCDATAPDRKSDATAQIDDFFGGGSQVRTSNAIGAGGSAQGAVAAGAAALVIAWDDPCAGNLDQINGALLGYYGLHRSFPPTLEQIPQTSPTGERISLTCPVSGKRYVYYPQGLKLPPRVDDQGNIQLGLYLILYDPEPSHDATAQQADGKEVKKAVRLASLWDPRRETFDVQPLEQAVLNVYLRNAQQAAPAPIIRPATGIW